MGNYLAGSSQVKEDVLNGKEADQATDNCLRNPLIVRHILEHFSSPELRQLSFVNKLWKCEAQSVMGNRGSLIAHVRSHDLNPFRPTKQVNAFISDLKQMDPVPFSGINVNIHFDRANGPFHWFAARDPLQGVILGQPSLKNVSVKLHGSWWNNMTSPGFLLAKRVLQDSSGILQELELCIDLDRERFMQVVVQDLTFPRLQVLKLREVGRPPDEAGYENYMKALVSRAPKLKMLHSSWSINLMLSVLKGSSVQPVYRYANAPFKEISEDAISAIQFEFMRLDYAGRHFNFEKFNRMAPMLLRASCTTTLHEVFVDAVIAVSLMCFGIRLESVKNLRMDIHYGRLEQLEPRVLRIIKNFDFSRIFPNLNKAEVYSFKMYSSRCPNHMNEIIEQANGVLREPMPDRAVNVKTLDLNQTNLSSEAVQFFAEMFPNIEKLAIDAYFSAQIHFGSVWNWKELKELTVRGNMLPASGNLDIVFCGIFPEEVAKLRLKDDEYLKRVNIVPVMPAVTCMRNLRTLSLCHIDLSRDTIRSNGTYLFSKVTALVAFARQPTLCVSLNSSARRVSPGEFWKTINEPFKTLRVTLIAPSSQLGKV